jgi:hypothetical protein
VAINEWIGKISAFFKGLGRPEVDNQVREEVVRDGRKIPAKKSNRSPKPTGVRSNNQSKTSKEKHRESSLFPSQKK